MKRNVRDPIGKKEHFRRKIHIKPNNFKLISIILREYNTHEKILVLLSAETENNFFFKYNSYPDRGGLRRKIDFRSFSKLV